MSGCCGLGNICDIWGIYKYFVRYDADMMCGCMEGRGGASATISLDYLRCECISEDNPRALGFARHRCN